MPFKKGRSKTGGRKQNSMNHSTKAAKELFISVLSGEVKYIKESLAKIRNESDAKYLEALSKLLPYVFARKTDITSDDEPVQTITGITIIRDGSDSEITE